MEEYFFHETHPLKVELNARYSVVRESRVTHICGPWFQANEKHCVCPKGTYVPWPLSTSYAPSLFKPHHVYTCTSRSVTWLSVFRHYEQTYRPSQEDLQDWFTIVLQIFVVFPCGERARFLFWLLWHRFFYHITVACSLGRHNLTLHQCHHHMSASVFGVSPTSILTLFHSHTYLPVITWWVTRTCSEGEAR